MYQDEGYMVVSDRALAWLLGFSLLLGGLTNFSPLLHLVIRHGSLDFSEAHLHPSTPTLHQVAVTAPCNALESNPATLGDHSPSSTAGTSDTSVPTRKSSDSPNHDHHGLPELLQWGMVDVAASDKPVIPSVVGIAKEQLRPATFSLTSVFDPVVAPRPPPFRTGHI